MSYRQPRVPEYREGEAAGGYMRLLMLFLKDFTSAAWAANNRRKKEMAALRDEHEALKKEIAELNAQADRSTEGA